MEDSVNATVTVELGSFEHGGSVVVVLQIRTPGFRIIVEEYGVGFSSNDDLLLRAHDLIEAALVRTRSNPTLTIDWSTGSFTDF